MKRTSVALGIMGLVWAVALPAANAAVLYTDDFNHKGPFKGVGTVFIQGKGAGYYADPQELPFTIRQLEIVDGVAGWADPTPDNITNGWLDWGNGDNISADADPENTPVERILLLFGEPTWADVAIQTQIFSLNQTTGAAGLVLRATPKTKASDPNTWYEFRYTSDNSAVTAEEANSGVNPPEGVGEPTETNLRILKVVNGKWTLLKEINDNIATNVPIPAVYNNGENHPNNGGQGMIMRFVAKGSLLQGFVGLPGQQLRLALEANDSELKAGQVGFHTYDYRPVSKNLVVEDAP